ncbi:hypothetical protein [Arthrobacter sp. Bz4]|nr:hypothetical protein [Arthrobacter sp. Bz4]
MLARTTGLPVLWCASAEAFKEESGMDVITIETPPLGDGSYLVHDG